MMKSDVFKRNEIRKLIIGGEFLEAEVMMKRDETLCLREIQDFFIDLLCCPDMEKQFSVKEREKMALFCLSYGVDLHTRGPSGETPLHLAITCLPGVSLDFIKALLDFGAVIETVELVTGLTAFDLLTDLDQDRSDLARLLIERSVDVNYQDSEYKQTPLITIVRSRLNEKYQLAKSLLKRGANPRLKDISGQSALRIAESQKDEALVHLLANGPGPNEL